MKTAGSGARAWPLVPGALFVLLSLAVGSTSWSARQGEPEDISFVATIDGTIQRYIQILPESFDPDEEHHVLIALHGHGADRRQFAYETVDEARAARYVAHKYRMIFISPDYRAPTSWMGPKAEADVVQIILELRARFRVGMVFLDGASMGGSSALTFAALHPDLIAGVASQNGTANHLEYRNFQDAIAESFGGTKPEIPEEYKKRSAEYWPENLTMPVAMTAGGADTVVPPESVGRLANILNQIGRRVLWIYREGGGHSTDYRDTLDSLEFVIRAALDGGGPATAGACGGLLFSGAAPAITDASGAVDLGLRFLVREPGVLTAIHFYRGDSEPGNSHAFNVWGAGGERLLTLETPAGMSKGWQCVRLPEPFAVGADEAYTVSYTASTSYPATAGAFDAPIHRCGVTGLAGTYSFDRLGEAMPILTYENMSYAIDVDYRANLALAPCGASR